MEAVVSESATKNYIVTCDVEFLIQKWCETRPEGRLEFPSSEFFDNLTNRLKRALINVFESEADKFKHYPGLEEERTSGAWSKAEVVFISHEQIRKTISKRDSAIVSEIARTLPWITLDRAYSEIGRDADYCIEVTRLYDPDGCMKIGLGIRPEAGTIGHMGAALEFAVDDVIKHFKDGERVVLVDDGLYSGSTMAEVVRLLKERGVQVQFIIAALTRAEGAELLENKIEELWATEAKPTQRPSFLQGLKSPKEGVRDWVCERDFFFGVPLSGRTAGTLLGKTPIARTQITQPLVGIPYSAFSTNDLWNCASLRSGAHTMARIGLELSLDLWEKMISINGEKMGSENDEKFRIRNLPRIPYPLNKRLDEEVVSELQRMLVNIP
jgi:hypothetical protein